MPLFGSKKAEEPPKTITTTTTHRSPSSNRNSFFSRKNSSPERRTTTTTTHSPSPNRHSSILSRGSKTSTAAPSTKAPSTKSPSIASGLFNRNHEDASIGRARDRLMSAEQAEKDADRALVAARGAVQSARNELKQLEAEAAEEARLAKIKQGQAASLSKRGKMLGRHDNHV